MTPLALDEETDKKNLRAADAIATLLYNWKAEALNAFMDLNRAKFEFSHQQRNFSTVVIARHGQGIMFGYLDKYADWEAQMLYTMSVTGKWIPLSGMMKDCSSAKAQIGEDFVFEFAKSILYWKKWEEHKNLEMEVSWTKFPVKRDITTITRRGKTCTDCLKIGRI